MKMSTFSSNCVLLTVFLLLGGTECARILSVFPMPTKSHFLLGAKFMKELAQRGHDVTLVSAYELDSKVPNLTNILLKSELLTIKERFLSNEALFNMKNRNMFTVYEYVSIVGLINVKSILAHEKFQNFLNAGHKFDLIIVDLIESEGVMALAHYYDCPILGLDTVGIPYFTNYMVGNPAPVSYIPQVYTNLGTQMSFYERLRNTIGSLLIEFHRQYIYLPKQNELAKQYVKGVPDLQEIIDKRLAMVLVNSHPVISSATPHVPAMVEIGGFHISPLKPLPQDLKDFLDNATDGVILFSMGSIISSAGLPYDKEQALFNAFRKIKQQILWKTDEINHTNVPPNVKFVKWLPQNEVLAHPNVKLFITHGGLLGITEAVYHAVPIVGIPVFADQHMNVRIAENLGYGLHLDLSELTEPKITKCLNSALNDPRFKENIQLRSKILRDTPMSPMDTAIYWTEFVLRHNATKFLKSPATKLHWIQLYLVDIIAIAIVSPALVIVTLSKILKYLLTIRLKFVKKVKEN